MFKKLVANLPFNPSLITQVGFYADRLRQERAIRRLSFVFMALAMVVQMFAVISPPERSLAASNNHIINGVRTKQDIINAWNNDPSVSKIYGKFGVTLSDINSLTNTPNTTIRSNDGNDWWTTGRNSLAGYSNVNALYKLSQVPIEYDTNSYVYYRQLRAWDIRNPYNTYQAFRGTIAATGETFWILVDCGNFTKIGPYKEIDPKLELRKTIDNPQAKPTLKPGDSYNFKFEYRNSAKDSLAKNAFIEDVFDIKHFDIVSPKGIINEAGYMRYELGNLPYSQNYKSLTITVKLKSELPNGLEVCNAARLVASNATDAWGGPACVTIIKPAPCPYNSALPANDPACIPPTEVCPYNPSIKDKNDPRCKPPEPCPYDPSIPDKNSVGCVENVVVCSVVDAAVNRTTRSVTFKTTVTANNPKVVKIKQYKYDFGDGKTQNVPSAEFTNSIEHTYAPGEFKASVTVDYSAPGVDGETAKSASCSQPISFDEDEPLSQSKTVKNISQKLDNEQTLGAKVGAGDVLEYTLTTGNSQNYDRTDIRIEDYIGDILDYATLDKADLEAQGGIYDEKSQKVIWEKVRIPAKSEVQMTFKVNLLNPIPATNQPSTVSTDFDCRISNEYGNEISLGVQCPAVKGIETIPNTGPGTSLLMGVGITFVVGYFFARSRLLSKELDIIRTDYAISGGM
jgi:hypothetical protein